MTFSQIIINWYHQNKRDLPWRNTKNAYHIWLSEIILQQTRVAQGMSYYLKFIKHFPTVTDLANAHQDDVLKLWQGLGYYSRARNLHFAAQTIRDEFNSEFPSDYKSILNLKGVGEYTAAAVSSFAFGESYPVIDGNVYRVLSRVFGIEEAIDSTIGKKKFKELAEELIDAKNPANHNQAIMEFGAMQCTPKSPNCMFCPLQHKCVAFAEKKVELLPIKEKKIKQKKRYFNYLIIEQNNKLLIEQRKGKGIWEGLHQFPLIETKSIVSISNFIKKTEIEARIIDVSDEFKHVLSHQLIYAKFWKIELKDLSHSCFQNAFSIQQKDLDNYAIPRLIEKYLES